MADDQKSVQSDNEAAAITMAKEAAIKFANSHPESQVFAQKKEAVKNTSAKA